MDSRYNPLTRNAADDYGIQTMGERTSTLTSCPSPMALAPSPVTVANHHCRHFSNCHHTQVRKSTDGREEDLLLESEFVEDSRRPLGETEAHDQIEEVLESAHSSEQHTRNASLQSRPTPQQDCCSIHAEQNGVLVSSTRRPERDPGSSNVFQILCMIFLCKRGIIARDDLIHALYIIPLKDFQEKFPKIKQYEGVVCHGTEFPMMEETKMLPALFHRIMIDEICQVNFEMVTGEMFSIVSPPTIVANVSEILSRSKDRVGCGFSATVLTRCTGEKDKLFEDNIRINIQSGDTNLHFTVPIAYYEANISPWLYNPQAVTVMPEEDRRVLRSCHVSLLENIGDPISVCDHLYQHKIFDEEDMQEVESMKVKRYRNAFLLRTIQTRGNILDLIIDIMRSQRKNQEAAAILLNKRHLAAGHNNDDK